MKKSRYVHVTGSRGDVALCGLREYREASDLDVNVCAACRQLAIAAILHRLEPLVPVPRDSSWMLGDVGVRTTRGRQFTRTLPYVRRVRIRRGSK